MTETTETTKPKGQHGIPKGYLGVREMCELLGISHDTIYRRIAEGQLPQSFKFGRKRVWDKRMVQNWLEHAKFAK